MNANQDSKPADQARDTGDQLQLVSFQIEEDEFAIDILSVQEINRMLAITRVPQSPACVEGVINLRGRIIPVVDLRKRFGLEASKLNPESRIIVVDVEHHLLGFIVDRVNEVLRLNRSIVEPAPALSRRSDRDYVRGVGKLQDRLLILLDLDRLFDASDIAAFDQVTAAAA
ncbi:MAG: chemotaxis protein CheW [Phycisphaeraceae bacterium]|nr:chemotaxis protein CheW [Phycisphaeraceae bacterium]